MYYIYNKEEAIRTVQKYLLLTQNVIFDNNTKNAVILFQESFGIVPSGAVDIVTFEKMRKEYYNRLLSTKASNSDSLNSFPYKLHDYGNDVSIINASIRKALMRYTYYDRAPVGNYFDIYTERAIIKLREIFLMPGDKSLDKALYARIKRDNLTA